MIYFFWFRFQCLDRLAWKSTWEASQVPHNRTKNRYCNVVACKLKLLVLMQVLKRFSSWRPNGKVDELQHWTEQTRQQSRFNAVPTCCRVSHIISQIFVEFYIEYQEKLWLLVIIFFSQLIEPIILNHVKYPFRLHLQSWVCIRIRYQLNSTFCLWVFEHSVCLILYIFSSTDDHSRVVLTAKRDIPGSDYINANYVDVRKLVCWSIWLTLILKAIFFLKSRTERYPGSYRFYFIIWCDWSRELALPFQPIKCAASTICD